MGSPSAFHHLHIRKRIHSQKEAYPHPDPWKRAIDKATFVAAIAAPLLTLPQLVKILVERTAQSISLVTWGIYTVVSLIWLLYGIAHKEPPIIIANSLFFAIDLAIVASALVLGTSLW